MYEYRLHLGDCIEVMQRFEPESIDLVVTSPPYDNLRQYGPGFDPASFDWQAVIAGIYRVLKPGAVAVWIVADQTINGSETLTSARQSIYAVDEVGFSQETMIYQQAGTGAKGPNFLYWQSFEYMIVWYKGRRPKTHNLIEDHRHATAGRSKSTSPNGDKIGSRQQGKETITQKTGRRPNVWRIHGGKSRGFNQRSFDPEKNHPAPFPEKLARDHILTWSNPGDLVLDPMMGSGTAGKMALIHGRRFAGIELDPGYFEIARQRLEAVAQQPKLMEID